MKEQSPQPDHAPGCPASPSYAISRAVSIDWPTHSAELALDTAVLAVQSWSAPELMGGSSGVPGDRPPRLPTSIFLFYCDFRC